MNDYINTLNSFREYLYQKIKECSLAKADFLSAKYKKQLHDVEDIITILKNNDCG